MAPKPAQHASTRSWQLLKATRPAVEAGRKAVKHAIFMLAIDSVMMVEYTHVKTVLIEFQTRLCSSTACLCSSTACLQERPPENAALAAANALDLEAYNLDRIALSTAHASRKSKGEVQVFFDVSSMLENRVSLAVSAHKQTDGDQLAV